MIPNVNPMNWGPSELASFPIPTSGHFNKIGQNIWSDPEFFKIPWDEKLRVLAAVICGNPPEQFARHVGPTVRVAGPGKRRPDLYSKEWRDLRLRVIAEDGSDCHYCGTDCMGRETIDHVRPVRLGGKGVRENVVVSCRSCNSKKGDREYW